MRHVHSLGFDALETRDLLSKTHVAAAHATPAAAPVPLVLSGTLSVDNNGATATMNADGSSTTVIPVAGRFGALGEVRGVWDNSVDPYGNYMGPDTLYLHDAKGGFILTFNDLNTAGRHPLGNGAVDFVHTQRLYKGSGGYAGASESGTIQLDTNKAKSLIVSLTLASQNS